MNSQNQLQNENRSGLKALMQQYQGQIAAAVPKHLDTGRLLAVATHAMSRSPKLYDCDKMSLLNAIIHSGIMGLSLDPGLGEAYLVPFKGRATLICGYRGLIKLAKQSGDLTSITAETVHEGDDFGFSLGTDAWLRHVPSGVPGKVATHYYSIMRLKSGDQQFKVISVAEANEIRDKFSKSAGKSDSPWKTDPDAMGMKSAVRRLVKWASYSPELTHAVMMDEMAEYSRQTPVIDMESDVDEGPSLAPSESPVRAHDESNPALVAADKKVGGSG